LYLPFLVDPTSRVVFGIFHHNTKIGSVGVVNIITESSTDGSSLAVPGGFGRSVTRIGGHSGLENRCVWGKIRNNLLRLNCR